ncbi:MAG: redoxin domain-containing protein [Verrucomicrobiota bacterium]
MISRWFVLASLVFAWDVVHSEETEEAARLDLFVAVDCPIANAYAPEINRLHRDFQPQGLLIRLVYPDPTLTAEALQTHRSEYQLTPPQVVDETHEAVTAAGATITPEAALFDSDGVLRYRGRIDNLFTALGDRRRVVSSRDLRDAIERVLAGETFSLIETEAIGCSIEPLEPVVRVEG